MTGAMAAISTSGSTAARFLTTHPNYARSEHFISVKPRAHNLFAKTKKLCGTASCGLFDAARRLQEVAVFDQAPEVLLVQAHARQGFDRSLQLQQGEGLRQELEDHRTVLQLAAQAPERRRDDAPVVEGKLRPGRACLAGTAAAVALELGHEAGFVQEFVAFEHADRVPGPPVAEVRLHSVAARRVAPCPARERRDDLPADDGRQSRTPVLPGQEVVTVDPRGAGRGLRFLHEPEVGDGQLALAIHRALPVTVAERVELLDVADGQPGLRPDPAAQAQLERRIAVGIEEAEGQGWRR